MGLPIQKASPFALTGLPSSGVPGACATRRKVEEEMLQCTRAAKENERMNEREFSFMVGDVLDAMKRMGQIPVGVGSGRFK